MRARIAAFYIVVCSSSVRTLNKEGGGRDTDDSGGSGGDGNHV